MSSDSSLQIPDKLPEPRRFRVLNQDFPVCHVEILETFPDGKKMLKGLTGSCEIAIPFEEGSIDVEQENQRLQRELAKIEDEIDKIKGKIQKKGFISRAPKEIIQETKERLQTYQNQKKKLKRHLHQIRSLIN